MNWQPIETCPKNGRLFIAWDNRNHRLLFTAYWDGDHGLLTQNEQWSGSASHWMERPRSPESP